MSEIVCRLAGEQDLPAIAEVMKAAVRDLSQDYYDESQIRSALQYIACPDRQLVDDGTFYVVEIDGRVTACGGWSGRRKLFTGTSDQESLSGWLDPAVEPARIRAMFVDPAWARRGLGRQILEAAEAGAARAGFRACELMATLPGVPLYRSSGYKEVEPAILELPDGTRLDAVRMRRQLQEPV